MATDTATGFAEAIEVGTTAPTSAADYSTQDSKQARPESVARDSNASTLKRARRDERSEVLISKPPDYSIQS